MNLIGNALKHARRARRARAGRVRGDAGRRLRVLRRATTGPGIAPEYHERIWGIFQTLEARDKVEGTGIGLSVVKKIVESRGGRVWVESAPGRARRSASPGRSVIRATPETRCCRARRAPLASSAEVRNVLVGVEPGEMVVQARTMEYFDEPARVRAGRSAPRHTGGRETSAAVAVLP